MRGCRPRRHAGRASRPGRDRRRVAALIELYRSDTPSARRRSFGRRGRGPSRPGAQARARRPPGNGRRALFAGDLKLLGEALAAGGGEQEAAEQIIRVAAEATGAVGGTLWRLDADGAPILARRTASARPLPISSRRPEASALSGASRAEADSSGSWLLYTIPLGRPPAAALRLSFDAAADEEPSLDRLSPFGAGAALALRRSRHAADVEAALKRSQTLVAVVSQAIAELSLAHTLDTAVERTAELASSGLVAVHLREEGAWSPRPRVAWPAPTEVAERLLELALGPYRSRGFLFVEDLAGDPRLAGLEEAVEETRVRRALFIPLLVRDEAIGALAVFRRRPRPYREGEESLLALSGQLAVAVERAPP